MASFRERFYFMPIGPDGKRHRVWIERNNMALMEVFKNIEPINSGIALILDSGSFIAGIPIKE